MRKSVHLVFLGSTLLSIAASLAWSQTVPGNGLPGDPGRFLDGVLPAVLPPLASMPQKPTVRAPDINLAVQAAQSIAAGCRQFKSLGIAVANADGVPILVYIPNGADASHGYTAIRKAYSAVVFKGPTTPNVVRARSDPAFAATIKTDPNLMAFKGGIPLTVGAEVIGAIGVSGAEPGGHDDDCAQMGVDAIKNRLK